MKPVQLITLVVIAIAIIAAIAWLEKGKADSGGTLDGQVNVTTMSRTEKAKQYQSAHEIVAPAGFINTDGITIQELIGKQVVLVDFWTYSCINCQRTLPYLTSWYEKYRDQGLEIVGIHTPEFEFEKKLENVQGAVAQYGIQYPVVLDNDYATWRNYGNRYWPRKYLIDIDGFIVYDHIGEGAYDQTEKKIQELLQERKTRLNESGDVATGTVVPAGVESASQGQRSPEIYFGASRNTYLGNGQSNTTGIQPFTEPTGIKPNILYLVGLWDIQSEFARNQESGAKIIFEYQAQKVFMVARANQPVRLRVTIDGKPIDGLAGSDVSENGIVTVQQDRLYRLLDDSQNSSHALEIEVLDPGLEAFTFTFG